MSVTGELERLTRNVGHSWRGWCAAWASEKSLRQWTVVNVLSLLLALVLDLSAGERAVILALGLLLMVVELVNTSIEAIVDLVSPEQHPLAGKAKDCASAAVMLTALAGAGAWALIPLG